MDLAVLSVFPFLIIAAVATIRHRFVARYFLLDDKSFTTAISTSISESVIQCGRTCVSSDTCESFFYNTVTGECQIHEALFIITDGAADQKGLHYYYIIKGRNDWCPEDEGFQLLDDKITCVKFQFKTNTWYKANQASVAYSPYARLVVLDKPEKNSLVKEFGMTMGDVFTTGLWIGLSEQDQDDYRWVDGGYPEFSDLDTSDKSNETVHDCVQLNRKNKWSWSRISCTHHRHFICEVHVNIDLYHKMMDVNSKE